ncbi:FAD-dependent oxidoreductase [Clostridium butanoliproducens]|uniref:FAD-dependent oxidoreductase n=1 Tax=Clostridium butanoliproducens TaxID=2991837 RepID=UPI0024BAEACB|nr:FAD-dependent oxidoreductase [Clostridium butanoliproducens]
MKALEVKKDIYWIGALDPNLRIFDIVMYTPFGTTYNSYVVKGSEKTAIFDTVKIKFLEEYLERLESLNIDVEKVDYIVISHTEPDHAGSVAKLLEIAKNAKVVGSPAALNFLKNIVHRNFDSIVVGDGDSLNLGNKKLNFISAPFLHWPDTIYTYIEEDNLLITCDSFGCHYCNPKVFNDYNENNNDYLEALKYYFDVIMGPFKSHVLSAVKKIEDLKIDMICPGHGPILREDPLKIVNLYKIWSEEIKPNEDKFDVTLCYVSAYGYTESLAMEIKKGIEACGNFNVHSFDVIHHDINDILDKINISQGVLFGTPTINGDALKPIWDILVSLNPIIHRGKLASAFGSYGWSGEGVPNVMERIKQLKLNTIPPLKVSFKPTTEDLTKAYSFGENFAARIEEKIKKGIKNNKSTSKKRWKCVICGEIFEGDTPPEICPVCGANSEQFVEVTEELVTFKSENNEKYVVIGNGIAGYYAADAIRKRNKICDIEIISSEPHLTYYRPALSDGIVDPLKDEDFYISPKEWYLENNIKLTLNTKIEKINPNEKTILTNSNNIIKYSKLIIANGSKNFIPPVKGADTPNVFTLRGLDDLNTIKDQLHHSNKIVVIGGGLLGLEAAWEFKRDNKDVTVIEFAKHLLTKQLDAQGSITLEDAVINSGVNIILDAAAEAIEDKGNKKVVKLNNGKEIEADMILFSVGILPNKNIVEGTDIKVNRGIIVNEKMETSIKDIYACGDVAEINGVVYGNWPAAIEMGKTAGANAAGDDKNFVGFQSPISFNAMNIEIFSCGKITQTEGKALELKDKENKIYKKLFFKDDIVIGGILIGDTSKSVKLLNAIENYMSLNEILQENIY